MSIGNEISRRFQGPGDDTPYVPSWLQDDEKKTEKDGYCWCEMCGYNAKLPAQYRAEVAADHPCPWCHGTTGALLCVEDQLAEHVIPDEPMMTWPQTDPHAQKKHR
jgi:hypothetical protein